MNRVTLIGNLGKDPTLAKTGSGKSVSNFSLATSESYVRLEGEKVTNTEWHNIVAFGGTADACAKILRKGDKAAVEGRITTRSYDDKDGNKRYVTEVIASNVEFLIVGKKAEDMPQPEDYKPTAEHLSDDLPF